MDPRRPQTPFCQVVAAVHGITLFTTSPIPSWAAQQVAGGPHRGRIDVGLREHPAPQEDGDLLGVDSVVLGFAAVDRFHGESVTRDEADPFSGAHRASSPSRQTTRSVVRPTARGGNTPASRFPSIIVGLADALSVGTPLSPSGGCIVAAVGPGRRGWRSPLDQFVAGLNVSPYWAPASE
jgi:hypothetical protein